MTAGDVELAAALTRVYDLLERLETQVTDPDSRLLIRAAKRELRRCIREFGVER